jgi:DNA-directed RNA polymerase subunit F
MSKKSKVKNLTIPQVKKILEGIDEEKLDHFQHRTYNYISKFSKVEAETAEKILEKLTKEFDLEEEEAVQIINCMPKSIEELKPFLATGRKIVETSKLENIVNLLNKYPKLK